MSATSRQAKGPSGALFPLVLVIAVVACAATWFLLIMREDEAAAQSSAEATALEDEIGKAELYMRSRPDEVKSKETAHDIAELLQKRLPVGRKDLAVVQYFQLRAADAGIPDFKYDIAGGMELPRERTEAEKEGEERLGLEPGKVQSQVITMDFTARYADFLKFQRAVAEAPWLIELTLMDLKRDKDNTVKAHVSLRYLYQ